MITIDTCTNYVLQVLTKSNRTSQVHHKQTKDLSSSNRGRLSSSHYTFDKYHIEILSLWQEFHQLQHQRGVDFSEIAFLLLIRISLFIFHELYISTDKIFFILWFENFVSFRDVTISNKKFGFNIFVKFVPFNIWNIRKINT